jgi:hypothetical protein
MQNAKVKSAENASSDLHFAFCILPFDFYRIDPMNEALRQTAFDIWTILSQGGWVMGAIFLAGQLGWFLIL